MSDNYKILGLLFVCIASLFSGLVTFGHKKSQEAMEIVKERHARPLIDSAYQAGIRDCLSQHLTVSKDSIVSATYNSNTKEIIPSA